ncbi:MAG: hypothetical protein C0P74_006655 [Gammaproteobacteria bacterium]|nr:hypothetical protein [Gammaproteobacteria bacterium]
MTLDKLHFCALARALAACLAGVLSCSQTAHAELQYGLGLGVGYTDNVLRDRSEIDETIGIASIDAAWLEHTKRLDADVTVNLSYFDYLDETVDSEWYGTADGVIILGLVPERFTWIFQDTFGQVQADPFQPSTPETRENLNYFTTGPDIVLRFGASTYLQIFGRYSTVDYEQSLLDAERTGGGFVLGRRLSGLGELTLTGLAEDVTFDDLPDQDFERQHVFLGYDVRGSRTEFRSELGYTWLELESGRRGGALANIAISRRVSPSSSLTLSFGTRFTDASESMRGGAVRVGRGGEITASADPFENRWAGLSWDYTGNRTNFVIGVSWQDEDYEQQSEFDRTRLVYEARLTRSFTPTMEAGIRATRTDEEFDTTQFEADETQVAVDVNWRLGRAFGLTLTVDHTTRNAVGELGEFDENRAYLMLTYRPRGGSFELMRP